MSDPEAIDPQTVAWTPGPGIPLAAEVLALRQIIEDAGRRLLTVGDDRLVAVWPWSANDAEVDVRYGFYRIYEDLELHRGQLLETLVVAKVGAPAGARRGAAATTARWSLHGLLLPLVDADLDRDPGGGEWTIRETLGHAFSSQRSYGRYTAWWLTQAPTPGAPIPDALVDLPERAEEAAGSIDDIRARLDGLLDLAMSRLGGLDEATLDTPARWSGGEVTVGFRIGRWASHLREHTIQVEKTLDMLGRRPTEVERLVRLVFEAYGRLEALVFGLRPEDLTVARGGISPASDVLANAGVGVPELVEEIVAAADANVPPPPEDD